MTRLNKYVVVLFYDCNGIPRCVSGEFLAKSKQELAILLNEEGIRPQDICRVVESCDLFPQFPEFDEQMN